MATSPIYNWPEPDNSDLVKNGALAIRTLGNAIDTTMATMVPKTIVDAKGDLIAGTAADTAARLAVGNNGETIVADSSTSTGLRYQPTMAAAKNAIINGGMDIWQRGTSSTLNVGYGSADRWYQYIGTGTGTYARESTVVPSGSQYSMKFTSSSAGTGHSIAQLIETANVVPFIGKTVVVSSQVAASTSVPMNYYLQYSTTDDAGVGATWVQINATTGGTATPTSTTFVPMIGTYAIPSNARSLRLILNPTSTIASGVVVYYGNVQIELGSVPTNFTRAGGTIQGETSACQRYYYRVTADGVRALSGGLVYTTTNSLTSLPFPVTMRIRPTGLEQSGTASNYGSMNSGTSLINCTAVPAFDQGTTSSMAVIIGVASGLVVGNFTYLFGNSSAAYLGWSAEL